MSSYILFLLLGLGGGAVYGILALGLVLKHRAAGVVDFGHGAVAMFIAYVYIGLRESGSLQLPWVVLPHELSLGAPLAEGPAIVVSLVYAAILGLIMYWLIYRPLREATALTRVCASVGTMLALQAIAVLNYGTTAKSTPTILPSEPLQIAGITVPSDRLWFAGIVVAIAAALAAVYRFTRFGLATRASAENEQGAALVGLSANRIGAGNWILATILAGVAGILIAPVSTVDPTSYTLFIVPALGVSLVQMSFAGLSGFTLSHLAAGAGIPFPISLLLASFVAVPLGLLIGLPALRVRGVNLAVVTLAAAFAIDALLFNNDSFSGGLA